MNSSKINPYEGEMGVYKGRGLVSDIWISYICFTGNNVRIYLLFYYVYCVCLVYGTKENCGEIFLIG